jgi:long-chain fatty acid transport protein
MAKSHSFLFVAGALIVASASSAMAGGFSRGRADTDILYEKGNFDARFGATFVLPQRKFATINGASSTDGVYSDNYFIPNVAAKIGISDSLSCAFTYTQPFGASSTYGSAATTAGNANTLIAGIAGTGNGGKSATMTTNEYGGTCDVSFDAGPGKIHFLGGLFLQSFDYKEVTTRGTLTLSDSNKLGYRIGAAFTIEEYALRADVMYRSAIDHSATGNFVYSGSLAFIGQPGAGQVRDATGSGTTPQSVRVGLQSGIAPDWLAYGSIEWTQWSVLPHLNYTVNGTASKKVFNYQDGWTIQAGVGHKFNDTVSGTMNLTWDRGVGTGADIMTDTWTLGTGASIKVGPGDLRLGAGVSYLTAGSQNTAAGATYNATADANWAFGLTSSYLIKF